MKNKMLIGAGIGGIAGAILTALCLVSAGPLLYSDSEVMIFYYLITGIIFGVIGLVVSVIVILIGANVIKNSPKIPGLLTVLAILMIIFNSWIPAVFVFQGRAQYVRNSLYIPKQDENINWLEQENNIPTNEDNNVGNDGDITF